MVLFLLRSAGSPWNLLRCGRRWTTSSSADCACQMQQPKAFVFRQLIFGINANPHYKSFRSLRLRLGGRVEAALAVCGTYFAGHRAAADFLAPVGSCFIWILEVQVPWARGASSDGRIFLRGVGPMPRKPSSTALSLRRAQGWIREASGASQHSYLSPELVGAQPRSFAPSISPATRHSLA